MKGNILEKKLNSFAITRPKIDPIKLLKTEPEADQKC